jgi:hypothetical protein
MRFLSSADFSAVLRQRFTALLLPILFYSTFKGGSMHPIISFRGTVGLSVWGTLVCVVGLVSLLSVGRAEARKGGLPVCLNQLATCQTDLAACEAEPSVVFPGDGQEGTALDFGLDHGPALSYTDNGDGTFTDNNTQLVWEKKTATGCSLADVHCVDSTYKWTSSAFAADGPLFTVFLAMLNTAPCFAGHCDWRIPTVKELQSIVDYSAHDPATSVPGATAVPPGPGQGSFYWSSTSVATSPNAAWIVAFFGGGGGYVTADNKSLSYPSRAVRGGQ